MCRRSVALSVVVWWVVLCCLLSPGVFAQVTMDVPFIPIGFGDTPTFTATQATWPTWFAGVDEGSMPIYVLRDVVTNATETKDLFDEFVFGRGSYVDYLAAELSPYGADVPEVELLNINPDVVTQEVGGICADTGDGFSADLDLDECAQLISSLLAPGQVLDFTEICTYDGSGDLVTAGIIFHPEGVLADVGEIGGYIHPAASTSGCDLTGPPSEGIDTTTGSTSYEIFGGAAWLGVLGAAFDEPFVGGLGNPLSVGDRETVAAVLGTAPNGSGDGVIHVSSVFTAAAAAATTDYEEDGDIDEGMDQSTPPSCIGGACGDPDTPDPGEGDGDGDAGDPLCVASPNVLACEEASDSLTSQVLGALGDMQTAANGIVDFADDVKDEVGAYELGNGPSVGPGPGSCPFPDIEGEFLTKPVVVDMELPCQFLGGPVNDLLSLLGWVMASIVVLRGVLA